MYNWNARKKQEDEIPMGKKVVGKADGTTVIELVTRKPKSKGKGGEGQGPFNPKLLSSTKGTLFGKAGKFIDLFICLIIYFSNRIRNHYSGLVGLESNVFFLLVYIFFLMTRNSLFFR